MKNIKAWFIGILSTALIFTTVYRFWATVDEKLKARFPETEIETVETETQFEEQPIETETEIEIVFEPIDTEYVTTTETEAYSAPVTAADTEAYTELVTTAETVAYEAPQYNDSDLMLLAKLIMNEAGADYCTDEHQRAVASVLLNHVASPSPDFPDTIYGCIMSGWVDNGIKHYGIESPEKFMSLVPTERAIANAQYVLTYGSTVGDAIYQAEFIPDGHEVVAIFAYSCSSTITYICR